MVSGSPGESPQRVQPITGPRPQTHIFASHPTCRKAVGVVSAARDGPAASPAVTFLAETLVPLGEGWRPSTAHCSRSGRWKSWD